MDIKSIHWVVCAMTLMVGLGSGQEGCFPSKYWMSCLINSCKFGGKCPSDPSATCKMEKTPCNGCKPVWHTQAGEVANCSSRQDLRLCPKGEPVVHCKLDSCNWPCDHPDFRGVKCRQSICGECKAEYLIQGRVGAVSEEQRRCERRDTTD
ncbi:hypothetical protein DPMN_022937 [Dreissena polymorpha]|uniref:Uncharacterized protein n=1 Tax=Dreissena polymorpha TaxID=45954 RepID=A0A9D4LLF6_DREPO|nr:hypothetical protein DPMN_022937 [Dreissena polymorpha]